MVPLHTLGLAEAARAIGRGECTSESLAIALIARTRALEDRIRAWAWLDEASLIAACRESDARRAVRHRGGQAAMKAPEDEGSLAGVPIGIKDLIDVRGMPTGMGSPVYADHWPRESAPLVHALARSGAIPMGKTVTTEFAFMVPSKTRNPWNPGHTPGGSSSGSAAAVACGMVPAALGTQTNGSVIRPAAFCGVVGFKPGFAQIATEGVLPFSGTLDQPGVFARCVADAGLAASWLTRRSGDIGHRISPLRTLPALVAVRTPVWEKATSAQRDRFAQDIEVLRSAGAKVEERELPAAFADAWRVHRTIMLYEAARGAAPIRATQRALFSDFLNAALDEGVNTTETAYRSALDARLRLIGDFRSFLEDRHSAVITPPAPGEAPEGLGATGDPAFCSLWTLLGVPAISIPTGLGPRGLPLGLQLVARPLESNHLLAIAAWCEQKMHFETLLQRESRGQG